MALRSSAARPRSPRAASPTRTALRLACATAVPLALATARAGGPRVAARGVAGFAVAALAQVAFQSAMRRRIGPERLTPADLLTIERGLCGGLLAGLRVAGLHDRAGLAGWLGFLAALWGATASDWLDGPLARRHGPTRLGGVLDIEADSWLTLWAAAAAVRWGGLPGWCLAAPLARYAHPTRALLAGRLPVGGGPWWARATGSAQMALLLGALAPAGPRPCRRALLAVAVAVGAGQFAAQLALLRRPVRR